MRASRQTTREGPFKKIIADGVRVEETIYLSGQVSVNATGETIGYGDVAAQLRQAYCNVAAVLGRLGADMADIVEETIFVTDLADFLSKSDLLFAIRAELFGGEPQVAQTLVEVSRLASTDWLLEIKCVARTSSSG